MSKRPEIAIPPEKLCIKLPKGTFSYSQYGLYHRCGKAYEFRYVRGIKSPPAGPALKGTSLHAGVEAAHVHVMKHKTLPSAEEIRAVVADEFTRGASEVENWGEDNPGKAKDATIAAYGTYHRDALPRVNPVAAEQPFVLYLNEEIPVTGFIDLIDQAPVEGGTPGDPGEIIVADLKYSGSSWSQRDIDIDPQFTLYAKVVGASKVRVDNVVDLKKGPTFKQLTSTRDGKMHLTLLEHMAETVDSIGQGHFPKTAIDDPMCSEKWCGYWKMCRGKHR